MNSAAQARRDRRNDLAREIRGQFHEAVAARFRTAVESGTPFAERLVHFWANHFAVSLEKVQPKMLAGDFEFRAIRPNLMGSFGDLLVSAASHPAMLVYLDQVRSVGPNSEIGARRNARQNARLFGLNENFAREMLELHTLGVRGGYDQEDVSELARALTGWTVAGVLRNGVGKVIEGPAGRTVFQPRLHEPGARTVLGKRYPDSGAEQMNAILADLAIHPATATHVATKLARHFIADDPPQVAIDRLARAFRESDGDLPTVYAALIEEPAVWQSDRTKFRSPWDWLVSSLRAAGLDSLPANEGTPFRFLETLGQPLWSPGNPAGWGDTMDDWAAPGALLSRVEVANRLATRLDDAFDARELAQEVLGEALRSETATAIARAEQPAFGLALLLASPEFLRR